MNICSQCVISAFGDMTVLNELKKFRIKDNGNAELTLDHFILYNVDEWGLYNSMQNSGDIKAE